MENYFCCSCVVVVVESDISFRDTVTSALMMMMMMMNDGDIIKFPPLPSPPLPFLCPMGGDPPGARAGQRRSRCMHYITISLTQMFSINVTIHNNIMSIIIIIIIIRSIKLIVRSITHVVNSILSYRPNVLSIWVVAMSYVNVA